ncbi:glycoside hydrolase family 125 protein [Lacrimispora celerecrescens]|uniref:Glycosyl hydrolase n=1 Tax=Lacrimispora celerecrescens TaxID=29354 RepID=A0A084JD84_9FIRM|nr:glycoside hydrolase family 125 protein [Lacrimispora celerecrescens]KEZ86918.1 glycosyl hydrolase [Lacrimispora celerecrescens]
MQKMLEKTPDILLSRGAKLEDEYKKVYPELATLVKQCFLNTMDTTVKRLDDESFFVITGDIPAMWLRDSAAQVKPYIKYAGKDRELCQIIKGIIRKQAEMVCIDPYANAFNESANGAGHKDDTKLNDSVWERKYEVDSLCAPVYLSWQFWKETGEADIFDEKYLEMLHNILKVFTTEQHHETSEYFFRRCDCVETDTLPMEGKGNPVVYTGMTWSGFRPSDDRCVYGYLIPANMMAVTALTYAEEICITVYQNKELARSCQKLLAEIREGIERYGVVHHEKYGDIYAYETDGMGHHILMDDANSPSLLAIPYLGYKDASDEIYRNTRRFILSEDNPYFYTGTYARGIGSPHTPKGFIWHIGLTMQALTSADRDEILECLRMIAATHAGLNYMHESFNPENPEEFTRDWFAWANSIFAELLDQLSIQGFWS